MSKKIMINTEKLKELYLVQNLSAAEIAPIMNLSENRVRKECSRLGFKKTKEQLSECFSRTQPKITEEVKEKRRQTCLQRYGCEYPAQNPEVIAKVKKTSLERYGAESALASPELREQWAQEYYEKYGVYHPAQRQEVKDKMKATNLERYGVENHSSLLEHRNKMRILNKQCDEQCDIDALQDITQSRDHFRQFIVDNGFECSLQIAEKLHYTIASVERLLHTFDCWDLINYHVSKGESEICEFINSLGVLTCKDRSILDRLEIDIFCPDYNIGIEYNGTYWHSDIYKDKSYHYKKSLLAESKGIRLIHIYQYEWEDPIKKEIIKSFLKIAFGKVDNRIYARDCEIKVISNKEAEPFNNKNHLQGHRNAQITYGLFFNNELVQLMSFSKHKKYGWEIIRGCPGSNNIVVGGVSKLFKHFIQDHHPDSIFSYCDFNKFDGTGYRKIGMDFIGYTGPDMKWIINHKVYNRNPSRRAEYAQQAEAKIWGSGSKKYIWTEKTVK